MLKRIDIDIQGLDKLQQEINRLEKLVKLQENISIRLAEEMLKIVNKVARQRINLVNTSNDDLKSQYLANNKYMIDGKTITLYNDLTIDSPESKVSGAYRFCVALAFEYGTGIIGAENPKLGAWAYDINKENNRAIIDGKTLEGWWIPKSKAGNVNVIAESKSGKAVVVQGYEGMEIYRFAREEIINQLPKIIDKIMKEMEV